MTNEDVLLGIGKFSNLDCELFGKYITRQKLSKNEYLLKEGEICTSLFFVIKGSFVQYQIKDIDENIIDLHLGNEWMFNQDSLTEQIPSKTNIRAFSNSEVLTLTLHGFHYLCSKSQAFLQFAKILNQTKLRTSLFDSSLNPVEKYDFILKTKPELINTFPLKLIASYLKLTPETLSRVRATF
uniref:Crp/Fnr family transcriptional regulator n=2 Tax=Roseivirga sp. TaxID=1964215 RepID=UPI004048A4A6